MILVGPDCKTGIESTVVDLTREYAVIVRPGTITRDQIQEVLPRKVYEVPGDLSL
jgi:L-threonylcarbamoyladenylate synthase